MNTYVGYLYWSNPNKIIIQLCLVRSEAISTAGSHLKRDILVKWICCMSQEIQTGALYQPRGVGWGGRREGGSKAGDTCIPMADSC